MHNKFIKAIIILLLSLTFSLCLAMSFSCSGSNSNINITLSKNSVVLNQNTSETILATITGTSEKATWISGDTTIAIVSDGKITAKGLGQTTITASVGDKSATCNVNVACKYTSPTVKYNSTKTFYVDVKNTTDIVTITQADSTILSVIKDGQQSKRATFSLKGLKAGNTSFTIDVNGAKIVENIVVNPIITLTTKSKKILTNGTFTLEKGEDYTVEGSTENVTFKSGDINVATVNSSGNVVAIKKGQTNISLSLLGATSSCAVTVIDGHSKYEDNVLTQTLSDKIINDYLKLTDSKEEFKYLNSHQSTSYGTMKRLSFSLSSMLGSGDYLVTLKLKDLNSDTFTTVIEKKKYTNKFELGDEYQNYVFPNREYYFDIYDADDETFRCDCGILKTTDDIVKFINIDGVNNVRDIGGWKTTDGNTVKYGLIYRGGRLNSSGELTQKAKDIMNNTLKLNTEIDLRHSGDDLGQNKNWFDKDKTYYKANWNNQYDRALKSFKTSIKEIFQIFANKDSYPIYFHCSWGADRTGTLAFLLNGLLGVSYEDLTRDFELTSFAHGKRWRSAANNTSTDWDPSGIMQDNTSNYVAWGYMYNYVMTTYEGNTLQDKIEDYLINTIGLKQTEIDSIKDIMLVNKPTTKTTLQIAENNNIQENEYSYMYFITGDIASNYYLKKEF